MELPLPPTHDPFYASSHMMMPLPPTHDPLIGSSSSSGEEGVCEPTAAGATGDQQQEQGVELVEPAM